MKRKANYNAGTGKGGAYSHNVPDKRRNSRLRPANEDAEIGSTFKDAIFGILLCALAVALLRFIL